MLRAGYAARARRRCSAARSSPRPASSATSCSATGGKVGPELTGSNRADLDYVLSNVLDPTALIGKDYLAHVVATKDGRVLTGIIRAEDKDAITLRHRQRDR